MSEYWKSTPNYWCKFCSQYVRDTAGERRSHEASGKHQGNIQRSLRNLHKDKEREERDRQRAKDEVARLNGLVDGKKAPKGGSSAILGARDVTLKGTTTAPPARGGMSEKEQRRIHAEQLVALGVKIPESLRKEIMGEDAEGWQTVSERVIEAPQERSLADIVKLEQGPDSEEERILNKGVRKRKFGEEEDLRDEEAPERTTKAWGSKVKRYPGKDGGEEDADLEALLSGVKKRKEDEVKAEDGGEEDADGLKKEESVEKPLDAIPDVNAPAAAVKTEDDAPSETVAPIVFKKRKGKK